MTLKAWDIDAFHIRCEYLCSVKRERASCRWTENHLVFENLRGELEKHGYIRAIRSRSNADEVLKPFRVNGINFNRADRFLCGTALKTRLFIMNKHRRPQVVNHLIEDIEQAGYEKALIKYHIHGDTWFYYIEYEGEDDGEPVDGYDHEDPLEGYMVDPLFECLEADSLPDALLFANRWDLLKRIIDDGHFAVDHEDIQSDRKFLAWFEAETAVDACKNQDNDDDFAL